MTNLQQEILREFEKGWDNINDKDTVSEIRKSFVKDFLLSALQRQMEEVKKEGMTNTNWDELKEAIKIFKVDGMSEHQFFLYVKSLLEQEKSKWLEALPKERDGQCVDPKYYISSGWKDRNEGWNACLKEVKHQLSK